MIMMTMMMMTMMTMMMMKSHWSPGWARSSSYFTLTLTCSVCHIMDAV